MNNQIVTPFNLLPVAPGYTFVPYGGAMMPGQAQEIPGAASDRPPGAPAPDAQPRTEQEVQASFLKPLIAIALRGLFRYLERHGREQQQLLQIVPTLQQAVHFYAAHNFAQALALAYQCFLAIHIVRAANPTLPAPTIE